MQLSEKPKIFSKFFIAYLKSALNFKHFERKKKKNEPHSSSISEVILSQIDLEKFIFSQIWDFRTAC